MMKTEKNDSYKKLDVENQKLWEKKTGYSYSNIRIHEASQVPAQIGTTACILNEDIYLAQGAEHLLDHELGHYPDQKQGLNANAMMNGIPIHMHTEKENAADHPVVHEAPVYKSSTAYQGYKIGMEFQTIGGGKNISFLNGKGIDCGTKIDEKDEIKITADNSYDLEFITKTVDINETGSNMEQEANKAAKVFQDLLALPAVGNKIKYPVDHPEYIIYTDGQKNAHPQATVGVRLENLYKLLDAYSKLTLTSKKKADDAGPFFGSTIRRGTIESERASELHQRSGLALGVTKAEEATEENFTASEKGFVALLAGFMEIQENTTNVAVMLDTDMSTSSSEAANMGKLGKNFMPIMPRTSPLDLFKTFSFDRQVIIGKYLEKKYTLKRVLVWQNDKFAPHAMRITLKDWFMGAGIYRDGAFLVQDTARWKTDVFNTNYHSVSEILKAPAMSSQRIVDSAHKTARELAVAIVDSIDALKATGKAGSKLNEKLTFIKTELRGENRNYKLAEYQVRLMRICYAKERLAKKQIDDVQVKIDTENILEGLNGYLRRQSSSSKYEEARQPNIGLFELRALETNVKPEEWGRVGKEVSMFLYKVQQEPQVQPILAAMTVSAVPILSHSSPPAPHTNTAGAAQPSLLRLNTQVTPGQTGVSPTAMHIRGRSPGITNTSTIAHPAQVSVTRTDMAGAAQPSLPRLDTQVTPGQTGVTPTAINVRGRSPGITNTSAIAHPAQVTVARTDIAGAMQMSTFDTVTWKAKKIAQLTRFINCVIQVRTSILDESTRSSLQEYQAKIVQARCELIGLKQKSNIMDEVMRINENIRESIHGLLATIRSAKIEKGIKRRALSDIEAVTYLTHIDD